MRGKVKFPNRLDLLSLSIGLSQQCGFPLQLLHAAAVCMEPSRQWQAAQLSHFCLVLFRLAKKKCYGARRVFLGFGLMEYDLTCGQMLYLAEAIPQAATHAFMFKH